MIKALCFTQTDTSTDTGLRIRLTLTCHSSVHGHSNKTNKIYQRAIKFIINNKIK